MQLFSPKGFERTFGRLPGQAEARAIGVFGVIAGIIMCGLSLYYGFRGETFMGRPLGTDFVEFYTAGKVLNEHDPVRIYDLPFLVQLEYKILPSMPHDQMAMYGNAPYVALLFRPLARLPYVWAYCVWLIFSMAVYLLGLWLLFRDLLPAGARGAAFLLAVSSPMYILETWIGGQVSILGFLAMVVFVLCMRGGRGFLAGLALGCAIYKPSLVAIPTAMLVFGAYWRALAGFVSGTALMGLLSVATVGVQGCLRWLDMLKVFRYLAITEPNLLRTNKYVDLNSFFSMLLGGGSVPRIVATVIGGAAFLYLAWVWWRSRNAPNDARLGLWAATISWAMIINVYVPVYDTIVLVPAIALVANLVVERSETDRWFFRFWLVLLYLIPWLTQSAAEFLRLQLFTILLAGFGYWVLTLRQHKPSGLPVLIDS